MPANVLVALPNHTQFKDSLVAQVQSSGCTLDIAPSLGHLALELIGRVGFGHSFHALDGGIEGSEYVRAAKELMWVHSVLSYH